MESRHPLLANLQILRAMAAPSVVVYHVLHTAREYGLPADALLGLHGWGKNGVDVFFVISGFVMVYAQEQRPKRRVPFLWDQVAQALKRVRVVPARRRLEGGGRPDFPPGSKLCLARIHFYW